MEPKLRPQPKFLAGIEFWVRTELSSLLSVNGTEITTPTQIFSRNRILGQNRIFVLTYRWALAWSVSTFITSASLIGGRKVITGTKFCVGMEFWIGTEFWVGTEFSWLDVRKKIVPGPKFVSEWNFGSGQNCCADSTLSSSPIGLDFIMCAWLLSGQC